MPRYRDDDDDRPRRRRRRDDEDEDEDEDDHPRSRRRSSYRDEDEDRPRRRKKKRPKQTSPLGGVALGIGVLALLISFMPCFASKALIPAGIGLITGFVALMLAQKSDGRQGYGLPIAAMSVSAVAVLIGVGWLILGKQLEKKFDKDWKEVEAEMVKEEAKRKVELEKAAKDVQTASPEGVIRVTAQAFYQASADDDDGGRFDRMYKNKVIEITGVFHEVNLTGEDGFVVLLKAGPDRFDTVPCRFAKNPDTRAKLTQLQPGQTVTIRGKCLGEGPVLEACILVN